MIESQTVSENEMIWIQRLAQTEKVIGFLLLAASTWFFADSYLEILGPDRHGFAQTAGYLALFLGLAFLVAGFTLRAGVRISWLGQVAGLAAILFAMASLQ